MPKASILIILGTNFPDSICFQKLIYALVQLTQTVVFAFQYFCSNTFQQLVCLGNFFRQFSDFAWFVREFL